MPTNDPDRTQNANPPVPREGDRPAHALTDTRLNEQPGGGGLIGAAAADDPVDRSGEAPRGSSPNAPQPTGVEAPPPVEREAALQAVDHPAGAHGRSDRA